MSNISLLSPEQKKEAINAIIDFFSSERGEEIGVIAAEDLLDMFLESTGIALYNKGVEDTKQLIQNYVEELNADIEISLKKQ